MKEKKSLQFVKLETATLHFSLFPPKLTSHSHLSSQRVGKKIWLRPQKLGYFLYSYTLLPIFPNNITYSIY